jgi:hypothetical protein
MKKDKMKSKKMIKCDVFYDKNSVFFGENVEEKKIEEIIRKKKKWDCEKMNEKSKDKKWKIMNK